MMPGKKRYTLNAQVLRIPKRVVCHLEDKRTSNTFLRRAITKNIIRSCSYHPVILAVVTPAKNIAAVVTKLVKENLARPLMQCPEVQPLAVRAPKTIIAPPEMA